MTVEPTDFGTGGFQFSWGDHICAIFDNHAQQMEVMAAFLGVGLITGQRCVWVGPPASSEALRAQLARIGGDLPTLEASGQLLFIPEIDFYLRGGAFDINRNLALLHTLLRENRRDGYLTMRFAGDLSYLQRGTLALDQWEEYESRLTAEARRLPVAVVCQALRSQLTGEHIVSAFRSHPIIVLGGDIHENPFCAVPTSDLRRGGELVQ